MSTDNAFDAVIVGSGPNGLSAAIALARAGHRVLVLEGADDVGGGMRSRPLTLDGFVHDVCSAIHPLAVSSPFFKSLPLEEFGVEWVQPTVPVAHPLDGGRAAFLPLALAEFGWPGIDARARKTWQDGMRSFVANWDALAGEVLHPPLRLPRHALLKLRFGVHGIRSASAACRQWFRDDAVRALFAGLCAHSMAPLNQLGTAAFGLLLGAAGHAVGWPFPRGGSQQLANAMVEYLQSLGGEVQPSRRIKTWSDLPPARAYLFDTSPSAMASIADDRLPSRYHRAVERFTHGMGIFKIDWALHEPIPWQAEACQHAGTVHVGGTLEEVERSERDAAEGRTCEKPFALLAQQSLFDDTRAPKGKHTAWGYCHVPNGSTVDMTNHIEAQVERFAPGFRDCILARHTMNTRQVEAHNPNYIGGDIGGGAATVHQTLFRPVMRLNPYATPNPSIFLCSSSTPPGAGVHGMCGFHAANAALRGVLREPT